MKLVGAALLRSRHVPLTTRLVAGVMYGVAAGLLLQGDVQVAGIAMVAIWIATMWHRAPDPKRSLAKAQRRRK